MICEHKRLRCTDGVFFCLDCGQRVEVPAAPKMKPEPKPADKPKRKTKKEGVK